MRRDEALARKTHVIDLLMKRVKLNDRLFTWLIPMLIVVAPCYHLMIASIGTRASSLPWKSNTQR